MMVTLSACPLILTALSIGAEGYYSAEYQVRRFREQLLLQAHTQCSSLPTRASLPARGHEILKLAQCAHGDHKSLELDARRADPDNYTDH